MAKLSRRSFLATILAAPFLPKTVEPLWNPHPAQEAFYGMEYNYIIVDSITEAWQWKMHMHAMNYGMGGKKLKELLDVQTLSANRQSRNRSGNRN